MTTPEPVVEHAIMMSGGSMQVRANYPEIERIYPLELWIEHNQRDGGKVYTRTVIVVEDWREEGNLMNTADFQDQGEAARQALGIDGTAGDAQDVDHPFMSTAAGWCVVCGLAESYRRHTSSGEETR